MEISNQIGTEGIEKCNFEVAQIFILFNLYTQACRLITCVLLTLNQNFGCAHLNKI